MPSAIASAFSSAQERKRLWLLLALNPPDIQSLVLAPTRGGDDDETAFPCTSLRLYSMRMIHSSTYSSTCDDEVRRSERNAPVPHVCAYQLQCIR